MPIKIEEYTTKGGHKIVRAYSEGRIDLTDADQYMGQLGKGGPHYGWPTLIISAKSAELTQEARKVFTASDLVDPNSIQAIVLNNVVMRVTVSFIMKVRPSTGNGKVFANEVEAEAWLDEMLTARKQPT